MTNESEFERAYQNQVRDTCLQERLDALALDAQGGFQVERHGRYGKVCALYEIVGTESGYSYDLYADEERAERCADLMTLAARR